MALFKGTPTDYLAQEYLAYSGTLFPSCFIKKVPLNPLMPVANKRLNEVWNSLTYPYLFWLIDGSRYFIYLSYKVSLKNITNVLPSQMMTKASLQFKNVDYVEPYTTEDLFEFKKKYLSKVSDMQRFKRYLARSVGNNLVSFWLDAEHFRRQVMRFSMQLLSLLSSSSSLSPLLSLFNHCSD